jgi:hypothetical protein
MKVDPNFTFWLGVGTTIAQGVASGTVHLSGLVPADWIAPITGWLGLTVFINMTVLTALSGFSTAKPGPLAPPPTIPEAAAVMDAARKAA